MLRIRRVYVGMLFKLSSKRSQRLNFCTVASKLENTEQDSSNREKTKFRVLNIRKHVKREEPQKKIQNITLAPRYQKMPFNQDWPSVWPTDKSFHPAVVPLPIHQGFVDKPENKAVPGKYSNAEIMKISNFLHLTPPAIKRHCEVLKRFCTKWPEILQSEEHINETFPLEVISCSYVHSSPTIRDPRSRIITLRLNLNCLSLDEHAKDKMLRLVDDRYNASDNTLTLVADRCPLGIQNYNYLIYILTALCYECKKTEIWEKAKTYEDMEKFVWNESSNKKRVIQLIDNLKTSENPPEFTIKKETQDILDSEQVQKYAESLTVLLNEGNYINNKIKVINLLEGESVDSLHQYKTAVLHLLDLNTFPQ